MAIATYERTLISDQSRVDSFQRGNLSALTPQERKAVAVARRCIEMARGRGRLDLYFRVSPLVGGGYRVEAWQVISYHNNEPMFTFNRDWTVEVEEDGEVTRMYRTTL